MVKADSFFNGSQEDPNAIMGPPACPHAPRPLARPPEHYTMFNIHAPNYYTSTQLLYKHPNTIQAPKILNKPPIKENYIIKKSKMCQN